MLHHRFQRARPQPVGSVPPRAALRCAPSWKLAEASLRVATRGWVLALLHRAGIRRRRCSKGAVSRCSRVFQGEERSATHALNVDARQCPSYWARVGHVSVSWARPLEKYKGERCANCSRNCLRRIHLSCSSSPTFSCLLFYTRTYIQISLSKKCRTAKLWLLVNLR